MSLEVLAARSLEQRFQFAKQFATNSESDERIKEDTFDPWLLLKLSNFLPVLMYLS